MCFFLYIINSNLIGDTVLETVSVSENGSATLTNDGIYVLLTRTATNTNKALTINGVTIEVEQPYYASGTYYGAFLKKLKKGDVIQGINYSYVTLYRYA